METTQSARERPASGQRKQGGHLEIPGVQEQENTVYQALGEMAKTEESLCLECLD